jgi:hypothetical protein
VSARAEPAGFVAAVRAALAAPLPAGEGSGGRGVALHGALTLLLVDGGALAAAALALPEVLRALGGPALRRPLLVVAAEVTECPSRAEVARALGPLLPGGTLVVHDPDGAHGFRPGRTSLGLSLELDDVLLDAETLVTVGPVRRTPAGITGGAGLIFPGLASRAVRTRHGARAAPEREREREEALTHARVDLQLCWVERPEGRIEAWAGAGRTAERAACRALGASP